MRMYVETPSWRFELNQKGQCCGRKPTVYKRDPHLFCSRCFRGFDSTTGKQIANWAWQAVGDGTFKRVGNR